MTTFDHNFTKSQLFVALNKARKAIRVKGAKIDTGRLNRAFGLIQARSIRPYNTTLGKCNCADARNGNICKHRIALTLLHYAAKENNG